MEKMNNIKLSKVMGDTLQDLIIYKTKNGETYSSEYSEESLKKYIDFITNHVTDEDREKYAIDFFKHFDMSSPTQPMEIDSKYTSEKLIQAFSFDNSLLKIIKISSIGFKLEITNDGRILLNDCLVFDDIKLQESLKFLTKDVKKSKIKKSNEFNKVIDELKEIQFLK